MTTLTLEFTAGPSFVVGVDTHCEAHRVATFASAGRRLGDHEFPTTPAGYERPHDYVDAFGSTPLIGIDGTSSYGAGLARHPSIRDAPIREINRPQKRAKALEQVQTNPRPARHPP